MMLSLIVSDAACGVNIAEKYPRFYQQMLADPALQEQFEDSLDLLRQTRNNTLEPLPGPFSRDLSFLRRRLQPEVMIHTGETGGWHVVITQGVAYLNSLFRSPNPTEITRSSPELMLDEDNWFVLLRQTVTVGDDSWMVLLEGTPVDEPGDAVHLMVWLFSETGKGCWQASVTWGAYQGTATTDAQGQARFPPLLLNQVLDETTLTANADLCLTLSSSPD
jgi:hypothetical protein